MMPAASVVAVSFLALVGGWYWGYRVGRRRERGRRP